MNKKRLAKQEGRAIRLYPIPQKRIDGKLVGSLNNEWILLPFPSDGKGPEVLNAVTRHRFRLFYDRVKEFQEPDVLILRGQVLLDGSNVEYEPFVEKPVAEFSDPFKLQLYDRRIVIYQAARNYLGKVLRDAKITYGDISTLLSDTDQCRFLFGSDMHQYIQVLFLKGNELIALQRLLSGPGSLPKGERRSEVAAAEADLLVWFSQQFTTSQPLFEKYMKLTE